jgi:hypothetical protein
MKKIAWISILSVIVFFFVGIIQLDNEWYENARLFIKIPPSWRIEYSTTMDGPATPYLKEFLARYNKRLASYKEQGALGEILAFLLVEFWLVVLFIKPMFSKKGKFILLDMLLFGMAAFVTLICFGWWSFRHENALLCVLIVLAMHYVVLRVLRPAKKYAE